MSANIQGQTNPEMFIPIPHFVNESVLYLTIFVGDPDFNFTNAEISHRRILRIFYSAFLHTRPCGPIKV